MPPRCNVISVGACLKGRGEVSCAKGVVNAGRQAVKTAAINLVDGLVKEPD